MTRIFSKIASLATVLAGATCMILLGNTHAEALDFTFSRTIGDSSNLSNPFGVALDSSGNLYVDSSSKSTITEFNSGGTFVKTISDPSLKIPLGVAFDSSNNLYVSNYNGNTITEFNSGGTFVKTISDPSLKNPSGVAFDSSNNLYVSNFYGSTIT